MEGYLKKLLKKIKLNESTISTVLGALVVIVVGFLIFNYFRGIKKPEKEVPVSITEETITEMPTTHRVEKGEHLWAIAEKYYHSGYNWVDIAHENNLTNPDLLEVGQELVIPQAETIQPEASQKKNVFGSPITGETYKVVKGDHLWGIAVRTYGDGYQWVKIARANNLTNPDLIHPGNVLTLPR